MTQSFRLKEGTYQATCQRFRGTSHLCKQTVLVTKPLEEFIQLLDWSVSTTNKHWNVAIASRSENLARRGATSDIVKSTYQRWWGEQSRQKTFLYVGIGNGSGESVRIRIIVMENWERCLLQSGVNKFLACGSRIFFFVWLLRHCSLAGFFLS